MNDLEAQIKTILNDPVQMAQIMQLAENFGFHSDENKIETDIQAPMQPTNSGKKSALLDALIPYLPQEKQTRLMRAVKIGKLSQIAGFALLQNQETE